MTAHPNRWYVKTTRGELEDVGAHSLRIDSGALIFEDIAGGLVLAYSPSGWIEVVSE